MQKIAQFIKKEHLENIKKEEEITMQSIIAKMKIVPNEKLRKKVNFFFMPYNPVVNTKKFMTFDEDDIAAKTNELNDLKYRSKS